MPLTFIAIIFVFQIVLNLEVMFMIDENVRLLEHMIKWVASVRSRKNTNQFQSAPRHIHLEVMSLNTLAKAHWVTCPNPLTGYWSEA